MEAAQMPQFVPNKTTSIFQIMCNKYAKLMRPKKVTNEIDHLSVKPFSGADIQHLSSFQYLFFCVQLPIKFKNALPCSDAASFLCL